ncbi:B3GN2 acetylglucosaminyltransferase, partial [Polypterus senegalus]
MNSGRRKVKIVGIMMMVNLFIYIMVEVSRSNGGHGKNSHNTVIVTEKRFWKKQVPSEAYWNRQQEIMDYLYNPILGTLNSTILEEIKNANISLSSLNSCEPDLHVKTQVKDYNFLPNRFKDFLLYMKCRTYSLVVNQPTKCKNSPFLLLAIKSLSPHFDRRQAIRESWGKTQKIGNYTVVTVFLLGNATAVDFFPNLSEMLEHESKMYNDILLWDYRDSFFNLTIKEVLFLEWFYQYCPNAQFIFKGDDDVFVNTHRIVEYLKGLQKPKAKDLFVGDVITNAGPHRNKKLKYFIPESMFVGSYPSYAGGGGFLYSGDLALRLYNISQQVLLFPIDDVYTGMCLKKLGLTPEKHKGFRTFDIEEKYRSNPCAYRSLILVHSRTPQEMIQIWSWLKDSEVNCQ